MFCASLSSTPQLVIGGLQAEAEEAAAPSRPGSSPGSAMRGGGDQMAHEARA